MILSNFADLSHFGALQADLDLPGIVAGIEAPHRLQAAECTDFEWSFGGNAVTFVEMARNTANAIAAHGSDGPIRIDDVHGGIDGSDVKTVDGLRDHENAVRADTEVPVTELLCTSFADGRRIYRGRMPVWLFSRQYDMWSPHLF